MLGAVCDVNRFLDDAAPAYVALLVLKEHMDLWPLGDLRIGSGKTRKQDYARPKTSEAVILREAQRLYRERASDPPNLVEAEQFIREKLPGARRKQIIPILKKPEFRRRSSGKQPKR